MFLAVRLISICISKDGLKKKKKVLKVKYLEEF